MVKTASPDTLLLNVCKLLIAHVRKVFLYYLAPKDFPLNTGPFYQCVNTIIKSQFYYKPTLIVKLAVSKEAAVLLCPDGVGCWRGVLASTLAKERVCSREIVGLLPITDFVPTLSSPMVGVRRRVNVVGFISEICIVFLWCSGFFNLPKLSRCDLREDCQGGDNIDVVRSIHQRCNPSLVGI